MLLNHALLVMILWDVCRLSCDSLYLMWIDFVYDTASYLGLPLMGLDVGPCHLFCDEFVTVVIKLPPEIDIEIDIELVKEHNGLYAED